jgi:hypothetical protein
MAELDPFELVVSSDKVNPGFLGLRDSPGFASARAMIREIFQTFVDKDGNFIEQLQTTGFDARIWELFLYAFLREAGVQLDNRNPQPDFCCTFKGVKFCIEAVTANPSQLLNSETNSNDPYSLDAIKYKQENIVPIRLGSALYSKLMKRYWNLPHVAEKPLVFAIEDFHESKSLLHTSSSLWQYLYGFRGTWYFDPDGELHIEEIPINEHRHGDKVIPSGFFNLPEAEHVSAVIFGNTGTVAKFNRMGFLRGYGLLAQLRMFRIGTCYNWDPNSDLPNIFKYEVGSDDSPPENWAQGLEIYHNPRALYPLVPNILAIAYHYIENGRLRSFLKDFHPYGSLTHTFLLRGNKAGNV